MQVQVGSSWKDHEGREFSVDAVTTNGEETWVEYCRVGDKTYYRCLIEAFVHRFQEHVQ